jgi:hypothetical protein
VVGTAAWLGYLFHVPDAPEWPACADMLKHDNDGELHRAHKVQVPVAGLSYYKVKP